MNGQANVPAAPSLYGSSQSGMSPLIAALRGNAPQGQMNPGVQFLANQPNAPTVPMTSYLRGQEMMQQMARQAQQPQPQAPQSLPKGRTGPIPQQSIGAPSGIFGPKGMAGPVPQQSLAPQSPQLSQSGLTFNPQRSTLPVAPAMQMNQQPAQAAQPQPITSYEMMNGMPAPSQDGLMAAIARQRAMQQQIFDDDTTPSRPVMNSTAGGRFGFQNLA